MKHINVSACAEGKEDAQKKLDNALIVRFIALIKN